MSVQNEIAAFFKSYIDAFARFDVHGVCALWEPVGLFPTPNGNFAMDAQTFHAHCTSLMDFYRQQGVARPEGELLTATELFPGVAEARMAYRMWDKDDALIAEWEHVYILRNSDGWRVSLTIADGEMAAWTARGAQL